MAQKAMPAEPYAFTFDPQSTALLIIDMQRDFVAHPSTRRRPTRPRRSIRTSTWP